jgi:hypothetical protein
MHATPALFVVKALIAASPNHSAVSTQTCIVVSGSPALVRLCSCPYCRVLSLDDSAFHLSIKPDGPLPWSDKIHVPATRPPFGSGLDRYLTPSLCHANAMILIASSAVSSAAVR